MSSLLLTNNLLLTSIFTYTNYKDVQNISLVNKKFNSICERFVWKNKCIEDYYKLYEELQERFREPY